MVLRCTSQVSLHRRHAWDKSHFAHLDSEGATFGGLLHSLQVLMNLDRHHTLLKREWEPSAKQLPRRGTWTFLSVQVLLQVKREKKKTAVLSVNSDGRNVLFLFLSLKICTTRLSSWASVSTWRARLLRQQRFCLQLSLYSIHAVNEWEEKPVCAALACSRHSRNECEHLNASGPGSE